MQEKTLDFHSAHVRRVPFAVKQDKAPNPEDVGLFRANAVVLAADALTNLIKQTGPVSHDAKPSMVIAAYPSHTWPADRILPLCWRDYTLDATLRSMSHFVSTSSWAAGETLSENISQPGLPRGFVGHVVGWIMVWHNRIDNKWTINLLEIDNNERVLEIGFGPGRAIKLLSDANPSTRIAGIDHSEAMLKSARRLNKKAIAADRVRLELGSVEHLPFAESAFGKVFSINCIYFWKEPLQRLRELHRVLKPTGCAAITVRDKKEDAYQAFRPDGLKELFTAAGFSSVCVRHNDASSHPLICVLGQK